MLKVGDNVVSLNDLKISVGVIVNKGTVGIIRKKDVFNSLVEWEEGQINVYGKIEWWIDNSDIELI